MKIENIIDRFLNVLSEDILPLTRKGVEQGNKIFGAAILEKKTLEIVAIGINNEIKNPLLHGEISCINNYWAISEKNRPAPQDCYFLSTHEPCSLCLSAITWSGFDNFYYLFGYEDSKDIFDIPHDLNILKEVFYCEDGDYAAINYYWKSFCLMDMAEHGTEKQQKKWMTKIFKLYEDYGMLSDAYQETKSEQYIPLA
ncbi:MAG: nucleoside deaminase [Deltaproteobacteria bacterium]|nr:nucleoside deaminase [Deltaproteobacteria bacterium]